MKKRALAVMLAGAMVLGAQTGVWAASDTSDQKEGELTLLMVNDWIDETGAKGEELTKVIKQYEEENPGVEITLQGASCRILRNLSRQQLWQEAEQTL